MNYKCYKTTMGHRYNMRICEDEARERMLFRVTLLFSPLLMVLAFAIAAGVI